MTIADEWQLPTASVHVDARTIVPVARVRVFLTRLVVDGECVLWTGYRTGKEKKYGGIYVGEQVVLVHRLSLAMTKGAPLGDGIEACHTCDVGLCVRPKHLFEGTHIDNVRDMLAKGRGSPPPVHRGEAHAMATLTDAQVAELRALHSAGATQRSLAARFNVSQSTVWRLAHGIYRAGGAA